MPHHFIAPPSKSLTHRAFLCAALAKGVSKIHRPLWCEDTLATLSCLQALGIKTEHSDSNDEILITGNHWRIPSQKLNCKESGTTWRFLTALLSALNIPAQLTGEPSLLSRPIQPLIESIPHLGDTCTLPGDISSQFLSALLLAAPLAKNKTTIRITTPLVSKSYVAMTLDIQKKFGIEIEYDESFSEFKISQQQYQPTDLEIEGDWSSAAFLIGLGLLHKEIHIEGLNPKSLQPDQKFFTFVKEMHGDIFWEGKTLIIKPSSLDGIHCDLTDTPDLYPILCVLSAEAKNRCVFTGIERLKYKESDRLFEMEKVLQKPEVVESKDHRIVMAAAVLRAATGMKMEFYHPECVNKSFPGFWDLYYSVVNGKPA